MISTRKAPALKVSSAILLESEHSTHERIVGHAMLTPYPQWMKHFAGWWLERLLSS